MHIDFEKISATGNDFVLIDNRESIIDGKNNQLIFNICTRRTGIGADGVLLIENSENYDFKMRYFNADGYEAEMCGNGARATASYAAKTGIANTHMDFEVSGDKYEAVVNDGMVNLKMQMPTSIQPVEIGMEPGLEPLGFTIVGVPHFVVQVDDVALIDVEGMGKKYCFHPFFAPRKTNVNFVSHVESSPKIRTYERGVYAETLSCGTGNVATAYVLNQKLGLPFPISLAARGGALLVDFKETPLLCGKVNHVYSGSFELESLVNS